MHVEAMNIEYVAKTLLQEYTQMEKSIYTQDLLQWNDIIMFTILLKGTRCFDAAWSMLLEESE